MTTISAFKELGAALTATRVILGLTIMGSDARRTMELGIRREAELAALRAVCYDGDHYNAALKHEDKYSLQHITKMVMAGDL